jgi:hypothetical protein
MGISIKDDSRVSRFRVTTSCSPCYVKSSEIPCRRNWSRERNSGGGGACGQGPMARKRSRLCYIVKDGLLIIDSRSAITETRVEQVQCKLDRALEALERLERAK